MSEARPLPDRRRMWALLILAALAFVVYARSLGFDGFHFDDYNGIGPELDVKPFTPSAVLEYLNQGIFRSRPVANFSFILNYKLGGYHGVWFRLVNILIHVATAFAVYLLIRRVLSLPRAKASSILGSIDPHWFALSVAALWLVHPIQIMAVTYIVQRMTSLATLFSLVCMLLFLGGLERQGWARAWRMGLGVLSLLLAVASKEIGILAPPSLALLLWLLGSPAPQPSVQPHAVVPAPKTQRRTLLLWSGVGGLLVLGLGAYFLRDSLAAQIKTLTEPLSYRDHNGLERIASQGRVLFRYLGLVFVPLPEFFNLEHDVPASRAAFEPWMTAPALLGVVLIALGAWLIRKRAPLLAWGLLFFLLHHSAEAGHSQIEIMFEHRNYMPVIGLLFAVALGAAWLLRNASSRMRIATCVAVIGVLGACTFVRNEVWQSEKTLYFDAMRKSPGLARPNSNYALQLVRELPSEGEDATLRTDEHKRTAYEGIRYAERAVKNDPRFYDAWGILGDLYFRVGRYDDSLAALEHWTREYARDFPQGGNNDSHIRIAFQYARAYHFRADTRTGEIAQADYTSAITWYAKTIERSPKHVRAHRGKAMAEIRLGRYSDARASLQATLAIEAKDSQALALMGSIAEKENDLAGAEDWFRKALAVNPDDVAALHDYGVLLHERLEGRRAESRPHFEHLLKVSPQHPDAEKIRNALNAMRN